MSKNLRNSTAAAIAIFSALLLTVGSVSVQILTAPAASAQTAGVGDISILVPDADIAKLEIACKTTAIAGSCGAAMQAVIAALKVANPTVTVSTIIASIASKIAFESNSGVSGAKEIDPVALSSALSALADIATSNGLTALQSTVLTVAKLVAASEQVDLKAVASGNTYTLGDTVASPA